MARRRAVNETVAAGGDQVTVGGQPAQNRRITAQAQTLDIADRKVIKRVQATKQEWQGEAWSYYDSVPPVGFATDFIGNAMSRIRYYIGYQPDPSSWPIEVDPEDPPEDFDQTAYEKAQAALVRMNTGSGLQEMGRKTGINLTIPGECFLVARHAPDEVSGVDVERFDVYSNDEIEFPRSGGAVKIKPGGDADAEIKLDPARSLVVRIWRPHPRRGELAITPMRRLLEPCEELLLIQRYFRSATRSRLNAGVWLVPKSAKLGPDDNKDPEHPDGVDILADKLVRHFSTPIDDEGSAAAVVPFLLHVAGETIDQFRHQSFAREFDKTAMARVPQLLGAIAGGVDLPDQVVLGLGDVKFRNAEVITDEQFKLHLDPLAGVLCRSWTVGYLYPFMEAKDLDFGPIDPEVARRFLIWYDPSAATKDPDQAESSNFGYENDLLAGRVWRRVNNYTEEDAPDEEELGQKAEARKAAMPPTPEQPTAPEEPGAPPPTDQGDDELPLAAAVVVPPWEIVTAGPRRRAALGARLAAAEGAARYRLQSAADTAMRDAYKRIGAQVRAKANAELRAELRHLQNRAIVAALGVQRVESLGVSPGQAVADALDELEARFHEIVLAHQENVIRMIAGAAGASTGALWARVEGRYGDAREAAWGEMRARLEKLSADDLFLAMIAAAPKRRPSVIPIEEALGEFDVTVSIPPNVAREVLSISGGVPAPVATEPLTLGGVATGPIAVETVEEQGMTFEGYEWIYGDPGTRTTVFEPHYELNGLKFTDFSDVALANSEDWPPGPSYFPGDHPGCQCDYAPFVGVKEG